MFRDAKSAPFFIDKFIKERGIKMDHTPRITIEVSGGTVQNVYTTLEMDVEVDILDFDDNGNQSKEECEDMQKHLESVISGQRQIY
jgi:hypothetical protein